MLNIGILIFDDVEELDFVGPYEVFSVMKAVVKDVVDVFLLAEEKKPIKCENGMIVQPHYSFRNCPKIDVLVLPGGRGARVSQIGNKRLSPM